MHPRLVGLLLLLPLVMALIRWDIDQHGWDQSYTFELVIAVGFFAGIMLMIFAVALLVIGEYPWSNL